LVSANWVGESKTLRMLVRRSWSTGSSKINMGIDLLINISIAFGSAVASVFLYRLIWAGNLKNQQRETELECKKILADAELGAKRTIDEAQLELNRKSHAIELREQEIQRSIERIQVKDHELKESEIQIERQREAIKAIESELSIAKKHYIEKLHTVSELSEETIKKELTCHIEDSFERELNSMKQTLREKTESEVESMAREMLITAMQRISMTPSTDATATIVDLPSEDMKGRIIGREGRNIRSFEAVTGTTLMIDETPDSVLISAFDPVKREIARATLESLLKDGRIHPSTIEAAHDKAKSDVLKNIQLLGEEAMNRLKLKPAHSEVLKLLGQLHFRLSLNQNSLEHSIEVAYIASMLASELGLDPIIAKRAALFHDIGKAMDHEFEGSHALIAGKMLRRYNEDSRVVNAVEASHEEVPAESIYAPLVTIADRISAMRPGARCDSIDSYVDRVKALEDIAKSYKGVRDAFALQAGREIRIIVEPSQLGDEDARELARNISREIEDTMNYPSTIKITVIREQRFCETAK